MKKLMKKKVNVFGKSVPVLLLVILGMGLVSAALVLTYGSITGQVTVESPITLTDNGISGDHAMHGGEEFIGTVTFTNNAYVDITTNGQVLITSNYDWEIMGVGSEFDSITVTDGNTNIPYEIINDYPSCIISSTNSKELICTLGDVTLTQSESRVYTINAKLNVAIKPDTYTFEIRAAV